MIYIDLSSNTLEKFISYHTLIYIERPKMTKNIYDIYINKKVFLVTKRDFIYNGTIIAVDGELNKLTILDRKAGNITLDLSTIARVEPRDSIEVFKDG